MFTIARRVRSPFVLSISLVLTLGLLSSVTWIVRSQSAPAPAAQAERAVERAFDARRRQPLDARAAINDEAAQYAAAQAQACRMPRATEAAARVWEGMGPEEASATAAPDPCSTQLTERQAARSGVRFYRGAVAPDGRTIFGGTAERGVLRRDAQGWQTVLEGASGFVAVNRDLPSIVYAAQGGLTLQKSDDGGQNFVDATNGLHDDGLLVAPFVMDANEPQRLWTGGRALWRTRDGAQRWEQASALIGQADSEARISHVAVSPFNPDVVLAGTSDGFILRSDAAWRGDANTVWPSVRPRAGFVSAIVFDPRDEMVVYATYATFGGAHVWRSGDGGLTWTSLDGAGAGVLPDAPINTLAVDPRDAARIYAGGDLGLFISTDGGQSWAWERGGAGAAGVEWLVLHQAGDEVALFAFTNGHGVWRLTDSPEQSCSYTTALSRQFFEMAGGAGNVNVTVTSGTNCNWTATSEATWITFASGNGAGNGQANFTVAANTTGRARSGRLVVAGREHYVYQSAASACAATPIAPGQIVNGALAITDCLSARRSSFSSIYYADQYTFTAQPGDSVAITMVGTGVEPFLYLVNAAGVTVTSAGTTFDDRTRSRIPPGGGFFTLTEGGTYTIEATSDFSGGVGNYLLSLSIVPQNCGNYALLPASAQFEAAGGAGSVQVAATSNCPWTARSPVDWVTITAGANGGGNNAVLFSVAPNTGAASRRTTLEIAGQSFAIEQAGAGGSCLAQPLVADRTVSSSLSLADCRLFNPSFSSAVPGERYSFMATAGQAIALYASSQTANFTPTLRLLDASGTVLATGNFRIPQGGFFNIPATGTYFVEVTSTFSFSGTTSANYRLTLFAPPAGCGYVAMAAPRTFEASGGTGRFTITTPAGCPFNAFSDADWIQYAGVAPTPNGYAFDFTVAANTTNSYRQADIIVNGVSVTIEQAGTGGSCATTPITPGAAARGSLSAADCRTSFPSPSAGTPRYADRYSFTARAGEQIAVTLTTETFFTPVVTLADGDGNVIAQGGARVPASGFITLPRDGQYLLEVSSLASAATGNYTISLSLTPAGCSYAIAPRSQEFEAAGGAGSFNVTAGAGCAWMVTSSADWVTINTPSGAGNGTVNFTVAANTTNNGRRATLGLGGQSFIVTQAGQNGSCVVATLAPNSVVSGTLAPGDCPLSADASTTVAPTDRYTFTGQAGQLISLQALVTPPASTSSGLLITLISPRGVPVTAQRVRLPLTGFFTLPESGAYTVQITTGSTPAGSLPYTLELTLLPAGCSFQLAPANQFFEPAGGAGSAQLTTNANCPWRASVNQAAASWLMLEQTSGTGPARINFTVAPNTANAFRSATITVGDRTINIGQAGAGGSCMVLPITAGQTVTGALATNDCRRASGGGSPVSTDRYTFTANAGDRIALLSSGAAFFTMLLLDANEQLLRFDNVSTGEIGRIPDTGLLTLTASGTYFVDIASSSAVSSYTLTLESPPAGCAYAFTPTQSSFGPGGGGGNVNLSAPPNCAWTARSTVNWITVNTPSGTGGGAINFTVAPYTGTTRRIGTITVSGESFTVEQGGAGSSCTPTALAYGQTINGALNEADCRILRGTSEQFTVDRYALNFTAGEQFAIEASASSFSPALTIYDPNGMVVASATTTRLPGNGFLTFAASGTYIIELTTDFSFRSGAYTLRVVQPAGCAYSLLSGYQGFEAAGGQGTINLVTGSNCQWTATSSANWVTLGSTSGTGGAAISFNVAANNTGAARRATLTVGNQIFIVEQAGASGSCLVQPLALGQTVSGNLTRGDCGLPDNFVDLYSFDAQAGDLLGLQLTTSNTNLVVSITTPAGQSVATNLRDGSSFRVPATGNYRLRVAATRASDYTLKLMATAASCSYVVTTNDRLGFEAAGGTITFNVVTTANCNWMVTDLQPWIRVVSGAPGAGSGAVTLQVAENTGDYRLDDFMVAGRSFRIVQAGPTGSCAVQTLTTNQVISGTLTAGDCRNNSPVDRYTFNATAGEAAVIYLLSNATSLPRAMLTAPNGQILSNTAAERAPGSGFIRLPATGAYALDIEGNGAYGLVVVTTPSDCSYALSAAGQDFTSEGGAGSVNITAGDACPWAVYKIADWITINAGASGTGNGAINYTVAPNTSVFARRTTLVIGGQSYVVRQAGLGGSCTAQPLQSGETISGLLDESDCFTIDSSQRRIYAERYTFNGQAGDVATLLVTASQRVDILFTAPNGETRSFNSDTLENRYTLPVSGAYTVTISGELGFSNGTTSYRLSFSLAQAGCAYLVAPINARFEAGGGAGTINITTASNCGWVAISSVPWLDFSGPAAGTGNGAVNFVVTPNTGAAARTGTLNIAGQTVTIDQAGTNGSCAVTPLTPGQTVTGQLNSGDCRSTRRSTSSSPFYADRYSFTAAAGQQIALQAASQSTLNLALLDAQGRVVAEVSGARLPAGASFLPLPGAGDYIIEVTPSSSFSTADYMLTLLVAPLGCEYTLSATGQRFDASGGTGQVNVLTASNCPWQARANNTWITVTSGATGTGNGQVAFTVAANTGTTARVGSLTIAGRTFTIEQAGTGGNCVVRTLPRGQTISAALNSADCTLDGRADSSTRVDRYSFAAMAGERIALTLTGSFGSFNFTLFAPDGRVLVSTTQLRIPAGSGTYVLPETGTYTLQLSSFSTTNYTLRLDAQAACSYTVTPTEALLPATGGTATVTVRAAAGCDWLVSGVSDWLTVMPTTGFGSGDGTLTFTAPPNTEGASRTGLLVIAGQPVTVRQAVAATTVSAASFRGDEFAPESLVTTFGTALVAGTPTGVVTNVLVVDSTGVSRPATVSFADVNQVNFQIPAGTASGAATVFINNPVTLASSSIRIAPVAPSLFAANSDGRGLAAGVILRVRADGTRVFEPLARFDAMQGRFVPVPIDLGPEGDQVFLVLFGTGFRGRSALAAVNVRIGGAMGADAPVNFAAAQGEMAGIDQVNALLPRSLAGRGLVEVQLTVDGKPANVVQVNIR